MFLVQGKAQDIIAVCKAPYKHQRKRLSERIETTERAEGYDSVSRWILLHKFKDTTPLADGYYSVSERRRLIRFKEIEYGVKGDCF